jgi:hypothetical protein
MKNGNGDSRRLDILEKAYLADRARWREQARENNRMYGILMRHDRVLQSTLDQVKRQGEDLKRQGDRLEAALKLLYRRHEGF